MGSEGIIWFGKKIEIEDLKSDSEITEFDWQRVELGKFYDFGDGAVYAEVEGEFEGIFGWTKAIYESAKIGLSHWSIFIVI